MPIPRDAPTGEIIEHFKRKGRPRKQAIAIALDIKRRRGHGKERDVLRDAVRQIKEKE